MKFEPKNEPIFWGLLAAGILHFAPELGYTVPSWLQMGLQGLEATMAGIILRSNVKGPVTVAREGKGEG